MMMVAMMGEAVGLLLNKWFLKEQYVDSHEARWTN